MELDVLRYIGAVTRVVTHHEHEGQPARVVAATRTYDTDAEDLWDALTSAERLPRWFAPVTGDLRLGGRYQIEGNAGGTITRCDRPEHLALTWEFGGAMSWVSLRLVVISPGETRLTLEHLLYEDDHWRKYGAGATGVGWDLALLGLALHLESGKPVDREAVGTWMASQDGARYIRESSEGWAEAAITGGGDPDHARAAGDRTTAFYTGVPE